MQIFPPPLQDTQQYVSPVPQVAPGPPLFISGLDSCSTFSAGSAGGGSWSTLLLHAVSEKSARAAETMTEERVALFMMPAVEQGRYQRAERVFRAVPCPRAWAQRVAVLHPSIRRGRGPTRRTARGG